MHHARSTILDDLGGASRNIFCRSSDLDNEASVETFFVSRLLTDLGKASRAMTGSSASLTLSALRAGRVWLRVAPVRSAATRIGTCSRERPRLRALPPRRRGLRFSFRSPFRLSSTKVSSASTIPASRSGACRTASRKRWRQRCAVLGAIPQRAADARIVSPSANDSPNDSQRSLWCRPDSAVPVSAPNVFPQALHR